MVLAPPSRMDMEKLPDIKAVELFEIEFGLTFRCPDRESL
jgi:hypothetical protein